MGIRHGFPMGQIVASSDLTHRAVHFLHTNFDDIHLDLYIFIYITVDTSSSLYMYDYDWLCMYI